MSAERKSGSIYHPVAVPAPDLHSCGTNVALGLILTPEHRVTAAARPLRFFLVFQNPAPPAGRQGDEVVPFGVDRIHFWILDMNECQGRLFRHGDERTTKRISGISRVHLKEKLAFDSAPHWYCGWYATRSCTPLG